MKKSKFTEAQVAATLRECESGTPVGQVAHKLGVSEQTLYTWKRKYGASTPATFAGCSSSSKKTRSSSGWWPALRQRVRKLAAGQPPERLQAPARFWAATAGKTARTASIDSTAPTA